MKMKNTKISNAGYRVLEILKELTKHALSPDEMLFIDDSVSNVAAAASLGIHAVQYVPGADLRAAVNAGLEGDGTC